MGAGYGKFKELEVGTGNVTGKLGKCITPSCVSKTPMKLTIKHAPKRAELAPTHAARALGHMLSSGGCWQGGYMG